MKQYWENRRKQDDFDSATHGHGASPTDSLSM
jgi:hypothetical protein